MIHPVIRALLQILPVITTVVLFQPGAAWAQPTAEPMIRIKGPFNSGIVYSVAFSPDGKILASGSGDNTIRLWDVRTGRLIRFFTGHGERVNSVAFSPDGKTLASGSADHSIKLWDVGAGKIIRLFNGHSSSVYSVAFSPDGKTLASAGDGGNDSSIRLWEVSTGRPIRSFEERNHWVTSVAFSPDGKTIASGSSEYVIKLWDVGDGKLIRSFVGHRNTIRSVAFSPDGKTLASGSTDHKVKLWEVSTGKPIRSLDGKSFNAVAFSRDGKTLAAGSYDTTVKLWDVSDGSLIHSFEGQNYEVHSVAFSPDGKMIASGGSATIKVWSTGAKSLLGSLLHYHDGNWIAFIPDNYYLSSEGAAQYISWRFGNKDYDEPEFRSRFYRPDIVAAGLSGKEVIKLVSSVTTEGDKSFVVRRDPIVDPVTATTPANGGRYHALLIAVQEYDHRSVNSLDYPVSDAQQVERELTTRYNFEPQNVTTLKNPDRRTILDALDQLTEKLKPEDNLLIFYAGHGQWDEQRKQGYWLPRDAMRDRRADWISNSDLRDAIRGIKARHILLISDACFAGGIFVAREAFGPASSAVAELDNLPSRTAMTSGALTTVPDRSVFVEYLLNRLRDNTEDRLPAMELFSRLRLPVINNSPAQRDGSRPTPRYGTIYEVGDEGGDFIFVRRR